MADEVMKKLFSNIKPKNIWFRMNMDVEVMVKEMPKSKSKEL